MVETNVNAVKLLLGRIQQPALENRLAQAVRFSLTMDFQSAV